MARIPAALHKRKKKKKKKSGQKTLTTYLSFGTMLHKELEVKADKISKLHVIKTLMDPIGEKRKTATTFDVGKVASVGKITTISEWVDVPNITKNKPVTAHIAPGKFKKGDKVILINPEYGNACSNPFYKGRHACSGTVLGPGGNQDWVDINWDNGYSNSYKLEDLDFDTLAQCKSIW